MHFAIEKAKLVKGETVDYNYTKTDDQGAKSKGSESLKAPVHADLKQAYANLDIHLAIMCGYLKPAKVKDISLPAPELSEGFHVTSFSLGGDEDDPGVVISGHYLKPDGKPVILNSPFYRLAGSEQSRYIFMDDLQARLERLDTEIRAYVDGTKRGADSQLNLFEEKETVTNIQVAEAHKPVFKSGIPEADPEAMKRVAAMYHEEAEVLEETPNASKLNTMLPPAGKKKTSGKKKVAQSAEAPSGELSEPETAEPGPDDYVQ